MTPKHYLRNLSPTYQTFSTGSNPATVTTVIGLPADPQVSWFLQYRFDNFIMTQYSVPSTVTGKNLATATQTAPNYNRRPVSGNELKFKRLHYTKIILHSR